MHSLRRRSVAARVRRIALAALAAGVIPAATPAISNADVFCVNAPGCQGGIDEHGNLQKALDDASASLGPDTVLVGDPGSVYTGPFHYGSARIPDGDDLQLTADGPGRPKLTAAAGQTVFTGALATLRGIDVTLPTAASGTGIAISGLSELDDVHVTGPGDGDGATGIDASGFTTIASASVSGTGLFGIKATGGGVTVSKTRVSNVRFGVDNTQDTVKLTSSHVSARQVAVASRGNTVVTSSVLETTDPHSFGVQGVGGGLTLDHVTVAHRGQPDGTDSALDFETVDIAGRANVISSALVGYTRGIRRDNSQDGSAYPIAVRDSVWDSRRDVLGPASAGAFDESGDAHVAPLVVDLARGDLRPRGGAAVIDRDTATDPRYTDVDGVTARDGDGNGSALADAGAFEYQRRSPSIDAASAPGTGVEGSAMTFSSVASDPDGDSLQTIWSFGDGSVGSGAQATHAYKAAGVYHVSLQVQDEAGLSVSRTLTIVVTDAPGSPSPGAGSPGSGAPGRDRVAPRLTGVRVAPKTLALRQARRLQLRFTVSERASLKIVATRAGGRGKRPVRRAIVLRVGAGRGTITIGRLLARAHVLTAGRWKLAVSAADAAGNRSRVQTLQLTVRR
jgi:PKD domain